MPAVGPAAPHEKIQLGQWLRLVQTAGVGVGTALCLLKEIGLPNEIFATDCATLAALVGHRIAQALTASPTDPVQALIERTMDWLDQPGNHLLTLADTHYPPALLDIHDPPILLYAKGRLELLQRVGLAVVGSRNATAQGVVNAEKFAAAASHAGVTVVSGMALGIDTAAHSGGLCGVGSTVAVIGTGIDIVYPARNRALAHRIAADGCLVSEYALGTPAMASNFPRRNRLISGLSRAVLVIEAAAQSGSLITARVAAEQGRDVFAIPGSIHSPLSKGCHQLIKQGAKLVESEQDILDELAVPSCMGAALPEAFVAPLSDTAGLLAAMGFDPVDGDALAGRAGLDAAALSTQLLSLEMQGLLEILPGGKYRRVG